MSRTATPDSFIQRIWYEGSAAYWILLPLSWLFAGLGFLQRIWYGDSAAYWILLPLSWLYAGLGAVRRKLYERDILRSKAVKVPVIVVGNITVGGTGKTPVTIWLAHHLKDRGMRPGIVSRGYGGSVGRKPLRVTRDSDPDAVGDEALLMARRSACPVVVHPNRVRAADEISGMGVDVIISDDGLQHYRLARDYEVAVVDGARGFGNRKLLPAGPLREPVLRLISVDRVLVNRSVMRSERVMGALPEGLVVTDFYLKGNAARSLDNRDSVLLSSFAGKAVHAVAAIGNPGRFFMFLESYGMQVIEHALGDHAKLTEKDLRYDDGLDVLMTEKDAVKCGDVNIERCWYVPVEVNIDRPQEWLDELQSAVSQ
ncbi:MAG: tetraacyldisaccharide 4'-kinase [Woeseiaceae bacterium]